MRIKWYVLRELNDQTKVAIKGRANRGSIVWIEYVGHLPGVLLQTPHRTPSRVLLRTIRA